MLEWSGVLPTETPAALIERVSGAIFRPPGENDMRGMRQVCGVFRPDGSHVDASHTRIGEGTLSLPADPPTGPMKRREGAWLFGGLIYNHFGHALIFSSARLWAVKRLLDEGVPLKGVLFHQRYGAEPQESPALPRNAKTVFDIFCPDVPIVTSGEIEEIEELYVPVQGISTAPDLFVGLPEQRQFYRSCTAKIPPNAAPRDIYISRTRTGWKGNHLFEREIERTLAEAGYLIFHPQNVSLEEQIATYRSARRLIAVDGSALHVAATAVPANAKVAVLSRREFFAWAIADQIRAFAGCDVRAIEAHADVYAFADRVGRPASWSSTQVMTDFDRLGSELLRHGFLDAAPAWHLPSEADLAKRLAEAKAKVGTELVRVPDHMRAREPYYRLHLGDGTKSGQELV